MSQAPKRSRRRTVAALGIMLILVVFLLYILGGQPTTPGTTSTSSTNLSSSSGSFLSFLTLPTTPQTTTYLTNSSNPFGSPGNSSVAGLQQALSGQSGLNAYISARECNLVITEEIQFCDTFPDNSLDATKWNSYGTISVSPGDVQFTNGTIVTKTSFYYSKFAEFAVEVTPHPPISPTPTGNCPQGWAKALSIHGQMECIDYAVWGFAQGYDANHIQVGIYWEQEGTQIRSHTRAQDGFTGQFIDMVSNWEPIPSGLVDFGINWSVDLAKGGAFADFVYRVRATNQTVYFSEHTGPSIPQLKPLSLFAASIGTTFSLHAVIVLPAWVQGQVPFVNL